MDDSDSTDRLLAALAAARIRITDEETAPLIELIETHAGIQLSLNSQLHLQRRLSPRLVVLGLSNYHDYTKRLRDDRHELDEMVERIVVEHTYFYRERHRLDELAEEHLPALADRLEHSRKLRIWSAACSTGEEAYTLAMIVLDSGRFRDWDVRLLGTDISGKALATARAAEYGETSFRTTSQAQRRKHFIETEGRWVVRDEVRALCHFEHLNLMSTERYGELRLQDVIVCRNVLHVMSARARHQIIDALRGQLAPDGALIFGHGEGPLVPTKS